MDFMYTLGMATRRKRITMPTRDELKALAVKAQVDWRTVAKEINAQNGEPLGKSVRGAAGDRVRRVLAEEGIT